MNDSIDHWTITGQITYMSEHISARPGMMSMHSLYWYELALWYVCTTILQRYSHRT